jgi:hypothetical protein
MATPARSAMQVVVLARAPSAPGKTRLTVGLPEHRARALREALLLDTVDAARAAGAPVSICFTPETAHDEMARLIPGATLFAQRGEDLGERMRHAIHDALERGVDSVVLVGSDVPTLPPLHVRDAFARLQASDLVLGPTEDGGFYLIAARRQIPDVFHGIDWSGSRVLAAVVSAARSRELIVDFAPPWWDADRPEDLQRLIRESTASAPDASCDRVSARRVREFQEQGN